MAGAMSKMLAVPGPGAASRLTRRTGNREASIKAICLAATVVAVFACSCSAASKIQLHGIDTSGSPIQLNLFDGLPGIGAQLGLVACPPGEADGRLEFSSGDALGVTSTLHFCFGEQDANGYGPEAELHRNAASLQVCRAREEGYCDAGECTTLVFFDICADFIPPKSTP